jgi:phosphoglucosamine mutase
LQSILTQHGITVYDAQILPTPALAKLIQHDQRFACGMVISASHNAAHDNGIKIFDAQTGKISESDENLIEQLFSENNPLPSIKQFGVTHYWHDAQRTYINTVLRHFQPFFLRGVKIVIDCAHGATYHVAPRIFESLGAQTIIIGNAPSGNNINKQCGSTDLDQLKQTILIHKADIGFAFDGDGDRVVAVNRKGQTKDGDHILALLSEHPQFLLQKSIVGTVMSNEGLAKLLAEKNTKLLRTPVGDKYINQELTKKQLLLGGEQSGHIILKNYLHTGDGVFVALRMLEAMMHTNNWLINVFKPLPQCFANIPIKKKIPILEPFIQKIINLHKKTLPNGRILIRYSGTENILRVMTEDDYHKNAQATCTNLARELQLVLNEKVTNE